MCASADGVTETCFRMTEAAFQCFAAKTHIETEWKL